jgi:ribosomal protein S18 acetylase RimI-like enzyme
MRAAPYCACVLRRARPTDGDRIAEIYLRSFHATLPHITLIHSDDEIRHHFATVVTNDLDTWVATDPADPAAVVGFIALEDATVDHLYLLPDHTGRGLGAELVALAQRERPDGLRLFAFQANTGACRFYERHGFTVVDVDDEGARNEEGEPDVRYEWRPNRV